MQPSLVQPIAGVAWPSFLTAAVLELAVFAFVDPHALHTLSGAELQLSATAVYSLAFLVFWAVSAAGCALTLLLATAPVAVPPPSRQG